MASILFINSLVKGQQRITKSRTLRLTIPAIDTKKRGNKNDALLPVSERLKMKANFKDILIFQDSSKINSVTIKFKSPDVLNKKNTISYFNQGDYHINQRQQSFSSINQIDSVMQIILSNQEKNISKISITLTGSADATPIKKSIGYNNEFGSINQKVSLGNDSITYIKIDTITKITNNSQLALLRTYSIKNYFETKIMLINQVYTEFHHRIIISKNRGGQFRAVDIEINILFKEKP